MSIFSDEMAREDDKIQADKDDVLYWFQNLARLREEATMITNDVQKKCHQPVQVWPFTVSNHNPRSSDVPLDTIAVNVPCDRTSALLDTTVEIHAVGTAERIAELERMVLALLACNSVARVAALEAENARISEQLKEALEDLEFWLDQEMDRQS